MRTRISRTTLREHGGECTLSLDHRRWGGQDRAPSSLYAMSNRLGSSSLLGWLA